MTTLVSFKTQQYFIENKVQTGKEESTSFKDARAFFYKKYIKTSYNINEDGTGYIIFSSSNPARADMSDLYVREANGLILEINTWKVVVHPHQSVCKYSIDTNLANKYLARRLYKIYRLYDGTKINLYFDRNTPRTPESTTITNEPITLYDIKDDSTTDTTEVQGSGESQISMTFDIRPDGSFDTTTTLSLTIGDTEKDVDDINNYVHGSWTISTTNGLNMNNVVWNGLTYQQALDEVLHMYGSDWNTFTKELDRDSSYTFSFKHPAYHPFREGASTDVYRLLHLGSFDLLTGQPVELPTSVKADKPEELSVDNIKMLYSQAANSYETFVRDITYHTSPAEPSRQHPSPSQASSRQHPSLTSSSSHQPGKVPCFGFVIRSVNPSETFPEHDLFIESRLMLKIRRFLYETDYNLVPNKMDLICLHNYLSPVTINEFMTLFPQFNTKYQEYKSFFSLLLKEMLLQSNTTVNTQKQTKSQKKSLVGETKTPPQPVETNQEPNTVAQLATVLLSQISSILNPESLGKNKATYFKNFILHPKFIYSYYNLMNTQQSPSP